MRVRHPTSRRATAPRSRVHAPEFPPKMEWLNVAFLRMDRLLGQTPCWSSSWTSRASTRTARCPTCRAWHERYGDHGLRVIGVHSPGYSFGRDRDAVRARGGAARASSTPWCSTPSSRCGACTATRAGRRATSSTAAACCATSTTARATTWTTERAIRRCCSSSTGLDLPAPLEPVRPEDAPGVLLEPQTADIALPARPRAARAGARLDRTARTTSRPATPARPPRVQLDAGGEAWAVLSGGGREPGLYE